MPDVDTIYSPSGRNSTYRLNRPRTLEWELEEPQSPTPRQVHFDDFMDTLEVGPMFELLARRVERLRDDDVGR